MASKLNKKQYSKELEEIRTLIQSSTKPFPSDVDARNKRIKKASTDLEFFGRTYFPHYIKSPSSALHNYICEEFSKLVFDAFNNGVGGKEADAAPRGNAKSTWSTLILPLFTSAFKYRKFPLILSETASQAEDFLTFIKMELENNERLKQDFPKLCGEGPVWRANVILTSNGIKIRSAGAGQKLRGMRHGNTRPDLVICDDLENDESVESPDQRKKLEKWFFKALMKIGQKDTVYIVIGTVLHYKSLLSDLLNRPGWRGKKFKSVISFSTSPLWEKWEQIFADLTAGKVEAENAADFFFENNKKAMLDGIEVLWPEVEDYYYLMKMRLTDGPAYFESEKQNEPINPEDAIFLEEWISYYDEEDVDLKGLKHGCAIDPSLGKKSKTSDPSAIVGGRMKDNVIYLTLADIEKRHPDKIIDDTLAAHRRDRFDEVAIEEIQFQEFFKTTFEKEAHKRGLTVNVSGVRPNVDKDLRIITLQPWIKNGWIKFKRYGMQELIRQLIYYRPKNKGGHDDGIDGLEMLKALLERGLIVATSISDETTDEDYRNDNSGRKSILGIGRRLRRRAA